MKLKPLHDWAVIVPAEAAAMTAGGLYIPDTAKEKPEEGVVEAIGPGAFEEEKRGKKKAENKQRKFIPTTVKPGDRVLYERWAGKTITIESQERIVVREKNILGLIDRPLQIPAATTNASATAVVERQSPPPPRKVEAATGSAVTETAKSAAKPAAKKTPPKPKSKKTGKKK